ncbi:hypothetical protein [Devosia aurantiaca]|uniref:Uncharacterized protein n=1 Tax=Devosia aurantiaca TaxID=2714858 RepID=A0A6M1S9W1_9HYPH|nr:hypothetical protein [Devosia aurantiaca]NGP16597.1 hypothetical protein [Devosia aurantiaca]
MRITVQYSFSQEDQVKNAGQHSGQLGPPRQVEPKMAVAIEGGAGQYVALGNPGVSKGGFKVFSLRHGPLALGAEGGNYSCRKHDRRCSMPAQPVDGLSFADARDRSAGILHAVDSVQGQPRCKPRVFYGAGRRNHHGRRSIRRNKYQSMGGHAVGHVQEHAFGIDEMRRRQSKMIDDHDAPSCSVCDELSIGRADGHDHGKVWLPFVVLGPPARTVLWRSARTSTGFGDHPVVEAISSIPSITTDRTEKPDSLR